MSRWLHFLLLPLWVSAAIMTARSTCAERLTQAAWNAPPEAPARRAALERALALDPFNSWAYALLGETDALKRDWPAAIAESSASLRYGFTLPMAKQLASAHLQSGDVARARAWLNQILTYLPSDPESLFRQAFISLRYLKRPEEAAALCRASLHYNGPSPGIDFLLGQALEPVNRRQAVHWLHRFILMDTQSKDLPPELYEGDQWNRQAWIDWLKPWNDLLVEVEEGRVTPGEGKRIQ